MFDAEHRGGRYTLKARRFVRPGVIQMPGDVVDLTHDEAVLALSQGTAVHVDEPEPTPAPAVAEKPAPQSLRGNR